jgi:PAS domain S-box-containing protein
MLTTAGAAAVAWFAGRWGIGRARREAERRLRDTDAHLQALIDNSSSAIFLKDRQQRFLLVNRRQLELWPEIRNFRPGMTPFDFFPADLARSAGESDDAVWSSGRPYTFERSYRRGNDIRTCVTSKFPVRDATGAMIAVGGITTDITELRQAQESVARKEKWLRRLIEVQENEKMRLCHEFHDGLIQYVVGSKMLLESLDRSLLQQESAATIDLVIDNLTRGLEDGRRVIHGIRSAALDDLGLAAAIEELCDQTHPGLPGITAMIDPAVNGIPDGLQTTVYRIVQESLGNARRHSGADRVWVTVRVAAEAVEISVVDSGHGFDAGAGDRPGFGLIGMTERVQLAGGEFSIESGQGRGTRVTARLPLRDCSTDEIGRSGDSIGIQASERVPDGSGLM